MAAASVISRVVSLRRCVRCRPFGQRLRGAERLHRRYTAEQCNEEEKD